MRSSQRPAVGSSDWLGLLCRFITRHRNKNLAHALHTFDLVSVTNGQTLAGKRLKHSRMKSHTEPKNVAVNELGMSIERTITQEIMLTLAALSENAALITHFQPRGTIE